MSALKRFVIKAAISLVIFLLLCSRAYRYPSHVTTCDTRQKSVLVTGAAGFIGMHTTLRLREEGYCVIAIDLFTDYYSVRLKKDRANVVWQTSQTTIIHGDIGDGKLLRSLIKQAGGFDYVINLAAQPGVQISLTNPMESIDANVVKFMAFLKTLVDSNPKQIKIIYASSSSVYGLNTKVPFEEEDRTDRPAAIYGASKKANELMVHSYYHVHSIQAIGLRFFTVYGPWGRPDMAVYKFADAIWNDETIKININGQEEFQRDLTYVSDIVKGITMAIKVLSMQTNPFYRIYNLGTSETHRVTDVVHGLEHCLGKKARTQRVTKINNGDVFKTMASVTKAELELGYESNVSLLEGLRLFCDWYKKFKGIG